MSAEYEALAKEPPASNLGCDGAPMIYDIPRRTVTPEPLPLDATGTVIAPVIVIGIAIEIATREWRKTFAAGSSGLPMPIPQQSPDRIIPAPPDRRARALLRC